MMWALAVIAKSTLVVLVVALLLRLMRRTSAASRHALCVCALATLLALPLLTSVMPPWRVELLPARTAGMLSMDRASPPVPQVTSAAQPSQATGVSHPDRASIPRAALLWAAGATLVVLWVLAGHAVLSRMRRRAVKVPGAWAHTLAEQRARLGVRTDVELLFSSDVTAPLTWGALRATIVLPSAALEWGEERQQVVLRHELAHVARRDAFTQLIAGITCALYWFHPGGWWLSRRLRLERENACDDVVLAGGVNGATYARHLLDVARAARSLQATHMVSIALASPSNFERRLMSVLDENTPRIRRPLPRILVPVAAAALLAVMAFQPVPRTRQITASVAQRPNLSEPQLSASAPETPLVSEDHADRSIAILRSRLDEFGQFRDTTVRFRVAEGGMLHFTLNAGGTIEVSGADDGMVVVTAAANSNPGGLRIEQTRNSVQVWSGANANAPQPGVIPTFRVTVPRNYNIRIESGGGWVVIRDVNGSIRGTTGNGAIQIERVSGRMNLSTASGDVTVTDSNLTGEVSTGAGTVLLRNVTGGLRGASGNAEALPAKASPAPLPDARKELADTISKLRAERVKQIQSVIDTLKRVKPKGGAPEVRKQL
jgi:beta-lactamase regulating signal transducer with metallopeptidase domain